VSVSDLAASSATANAAAAAMLPWLRCNAEVKNAWDKRQTRQLLSQMAAKLKRFLLRYFPPGIILEYETDGVVDQKTVDLLTLSVDTDVEVLLSQIVRHEPLISESRKPQLRKLVYKLIEKQVRARARA
jgi:hypothetical protein